MSNRCKGYHVNSFKAFLIERGYEPPVKFASVIGLNEDRMRRRINGDLPLDYEYLYRIKSYFRMSDEDFCRIFFDTSSNDIKGI